MEEFKWVDVHYAKLIKEILSNTENNDSVVTLKVGDEKINAHPSVLCYVSPYFRAMKRTGLRESLEHETEFRDIKYNVLCDIIHFIHTGEIKITKLNVYDIMQNMDYFCFYLIKPAVVHFLLNTINSNNCLEILFYLNLFEYKDIIPIILNYIFENYEQAINNQVFLEVTPNIVKMITCNHALTFTDAAQALSIWLQHNLQDNSKINFSNYESLCTYFEKLSAAHAKNVELLDLLTSFKEFAFEKRVEIDNYTENHSNRTQTYQQVIFAICGSANEKIYSSCECYVNDSWSMMLPVHPSRSSSDSVNMIIPKLTEKRTLFGCAYRDHEIFVIAGTKVGKMFDNCTVYNSKTNKWTEISPLPSARLGLAAIFHNDTLYAIGGGIYESFELKPKHDVLKYIEKENCWMECTPLLEARAYHQACNVRGTLYVVGGEDTVGNLTSVEQYYEDLERWVKITDLPEVKAEFGCIHFNEYIYIFGGFHEQFILNSTHRYNTLTDRWERRSDMMLPKSGFSCVAKDGKIYCVGGRDNVHGPLANMEIYNPLTDRWNFSANRLQIPRYYGAAALVTTILT